jgi:hypothetical protein
MHQARISYGCILLCTLIAGRCSLLAGAVQSCANDEGFSCGCVPSPDRRLSAAIAQPPGLSSKRILVYRVDFSDAAGAAIASNTAATLIAELNTYYSGMSYGLMTIAAAEAGSVITDTLRLPERSTAYDNKFERLMTATRQVAADAGHRFEDFDFDIVCTGAKPFLVFGAVAYVGGPGLWLGNNNFNVGVAGHEMGHNLGLPHASFWFTGDLSSIGPGKKEEYGDPFDSMGVPGTSTRHFNTRFKSFLGWIPEGDITGVTSNGTYRLSAHDHPSATGVRALRTARTSAQDYWIEFRHSFNNRWVTNGVTLRWATANVADNTLLIDVTPGTPAGKTDSPLVIGRTFSDRCLDLHITPVAKIGPPPEALDVVIQRGPFPGNLPPVVNISASATDIVAQTTVTFQATASDPNGDALAYYWDFGDAVSYGPNQANVQFTWPRDGEYVVRCTVTDMKGGTASDSVVVRVGAITTFAIEGTLRRNGLPVEGALLKAGTRFTYSDSDGTYRVTRLAAGRQIIAGVLDGFSLVNDGFENPVTVGPNATGADLTAILEDLNGLTLISTGAVWKYLDTGQSPAPDWISRTYDDSAWRSGRAKLGYGLGDEATTVSFGTNAADRYITTWFRKAFTLDATNGINHVAFRLRRDDGAVVYLNGTELYRENMPLGVVQSTTIAIGDANTAEEATYFKRLFAGPILRQGTNVVAVEIHQVSTNNFDLSFDLDLVALSEDGNQFRPDIEISRADSDCVLQWPAVYAGWNLTTATTLPSEAWLPFLAPVIESNGWMLARFASTNALNFFRLTKGFCPAR